MDQYLTVSSRAQPTKLMTTRWRMVLAKRKSANALSGEMPWNSPLFWGLIWIRRQTAWQRKNERLEITKESHGGKHSLPRAAHPSLGHCSTRIPHETITLSLLQDEQNTSRGFAQGFYTTPLHHRGWPSESQVEHACNGTGLAQKWGCFNVLY